MTADAKRNPQLEELVDVLQTILLLTTDLQRNTKASAQHVVDLAAAAERAARLVKQFRHSEHDPRRV